jgi:hypothetical protein
LWPIVPVRWLELNDRICWHRRHSPLGVQRLKRVASRRWAATGGFRHWNGRNRPTPAGRPIHDGLCLTRVSGRSPGSGEGPNLPRSGRTCACHQRLTIPWPKGVAQAAPESAPQQLAKELSRILLEFDTRSVWYAIGARTPRHVFLCPARETAIIAVAGNNGGATSDGRRNGA